MLGTLGIVGAPFLLIDIYLHNPDGNPENYVHSSSGGFFGLVYISAWLCSAYGLYRLRATGTSRFGKAILLVLMSTLVLANGWNIYEIIQPHARTPLYNFLDMFWPGSNLMMFFVGMATLAAGRLSGWRRYVPLLVGLWLPFSALALFYIIGKSMLVMYAVGLYSAIMWTLMGYMIRTSQPAPRVAEQKVPFEV
ncbi:hypothetical protein GCM10023187_42240 [Nibrella viscosa]|uniref:DUF998 domain-containing protein n=1 Tax=Nibrella viscosa TaxID=1084524 RepID=A0ABP8KRN2_9BACT